MWHVFKNTRTAAWYRIMRYSIAHWHGSLSGRRLIANPPPLLSKRLQLLGLDATYVAVAQPETLRNLSERCRDCAHTDECAGDLAVDNAAAGMDSYCANGDMIDDLVIKRANG
jgi:Family of unknown function (DUF6455)